MGSVFKRGLSVVVKYQDASGKWHHERQPSGTSKTAARDLLSDIEAKVRRQRHGLEPEVVAGGPETMGDVFDWYAREFIRDGKGRCYRTAINQYLVDLRPIRATSLSGVDVVAWQHRMAKTYAPTTCNLARSALRAIVNKAKQHGKLPPRDNPVTASRPVRVDRKAGAALEPEGLQALLAACGDDRWWRNVIAVAAWTGMRWSEIQAMRAGDVNMDRRTIMIPVSKGGHADEIPIAADLAPYMVAALDMAVGCEFVFGPARMSGSVHNRWKSLVSAAGLPSTVRFHDLRHTTGTMLMRAGVALNIVQRMLRHSSPIVTANVYAHVACSDLQKAVDAMRIAGVDKQNGAAAVQMGANQDTGRPTDRISPALAGIGTVSHPVVSNGETGSVVPHGVDGDTSDSTSSGAHAVRLDYVVAPPQAPSTPPLKDGE